MGPTDRAVFTCADCGASAPSFGIDYDRLGYPVCPACEAVESPLGGPGARVRP
ncbi:hypothetical protein ACFQRB_01045 [Halobaculum litoreum]|uniref:Small CPxCG-related zinc finger protein n=1 Tax=Halobaculum litoreum TaxID=3031998 RepID=A0ABD5XPV4_9EURY